MTDITLLARKLQQRVKWQTVPEDVTMEDLTVLIADAIRDLYVMTGRGYHFDESKFNYDQDGAMYISFEDDLP